MGSLILIILAGVLIAISFPGYFIPFSFVAGFFILFKVTDNLPLKKNITYVFLTGFVYSLLTLYWTMYAITYYGGVSLFLGIPLLLLLSAVFSFFQFNIPFLFFYFFKNRYKNLAYLLFPFLWVLGEILREYFPFGGFPWNYLGYTLSYFNSFAQITSVFSIYFLSFLAILTPSFLFFSYKKGKNVFLASIVGLFSVYVALHFYGLYRIENYKDTGIKKKVAVIQGNISQDIKLQNKNPEAVIDKYINLMKEAYKSKPDLIILPESALPFFYINGDENLKLYFLLKIKDIKTPILLGSDTVFYKDDTIAIYNSIILLDSWKNVTGIYHKIKLVPFGEYVPFPFKIFSKLFPYLEGYDFSKGEKQNVLVLDNWKVAPLICFEAIFPDFVADIAKKGNILVNISNDAWFGKTVAPFQHFEMARVRAIENGLYLVRGTNTGISAVVSPVGEIKAKLPLFEKGYIISNVYLTEKKTFWNKYHKQIIFMFLSFFIVNIFLLEIQKGGRNGRKDRRNKGRNK